MIDLVRFFRSKPAAGAAETSELHIYRSLGPKRIVIVTLFGIAREKHDEIIEKVGERFAALDKIVYVTDIPEFLHFRSAGAAFEYFPSSDEQSRHTDTLDWRQYLRVRWDLLLAKWQPEHVLAYGINIDSFLAAAPVALDGSAA